MGTKEVMLYKVLLSTEEILAIRNSLTFDIQQMETIRDNPFQNDRDFWQERITKATYALAVLDDPTRREFVL